MAAIFIYNGSAVSLQNKVFRHAPQIGVWASVVARRRKTILSAVALTVHSMAQGSKECRASNHGAGSNYQCRDIRFGWPYLNNAFYSVADTIARGCLLALLPRNQYVNRVLDNHFFS
jgi:hypothetical protein